MCGIVGSYNFTGKYKAGMEATMRNLLWADTIRGSDATGVYVLDKNNEVDWVKQCVDGWTFLHSNTRAKAILGDAENHQIIIGHNRSATLGSYNNAEYAHPIVIPDKLGLVHNGTLTYWPGKHKVGATPHDSTAIATLLAEATTQEFVDQCHGSYSLVWHEWESNRLHFLRNDERPMAMVFTEERVFFGSELLMLNWIAQRNGFKIVKYFHTEPLSKYTFELGESEPRIEKITKSLSSAAGQRFQETEAGHWNDHEYDAYRHYGSAASRPSNRNQGAGYSWPNGSAVTRGNGTERLSGPASSTAFTGNGSGNIQTPHQTTTPSTEGSQKGQETTAATSKARSANVVDIKPKGKGVPLYKVFRQGEEIMFSLADYTDVKVDKDGVGRYNIQADPVDGDQYPEVQVRGTVRVSDIPPAVMQRSTHYLKGVVSHIMLCEGGNVIVWVKDVSLSQIEDPEWVKIHKGIDRTKDKTSPGVLLAAPELEGKNFCQGCDQLFKNSKLKTVTETCGETTETRKAFVFRFCEPCALKYVDKRDEVVPTNARGHTPIDAVIRKFQ